MCPTSPSLLPSFSHSFKLSLHTKNPSRGKDHFQKREIASGKKRSYCLVRWTGWPWTGHTAISVSGVTATPWWKGGSKGVSLRSLWPLSYTKQMRTGVALLFWEFLGKPQLAGRPQNMRIWVWSNLLQRTFTHLIHVRNAQFMVLEMQLVVC